MDIYVGNIPFALTDEEMQGIFSEYGEVESARILTDRETGRSKGFGFVKMPNDSDGEAAIEALNESEVMGRALRVRKAEPRPERTDRPRRPEGGDRRGGGGGGRGGDRRGGGGNFRR